MASASDLVTLKKRSAFLAVAATGKKWVVPGLILQLGPVRAPDGVRFGLTATKKIGNAVVRNRAKRRLRALAREVLLTQASPDRDYVLIARADTGSRDYNMLREDLIRGLQRMKILRDGGKN